MPQTLSCLSHLFLHYTGTVTPTPENLSYNIPIDTNGDGTTEFFLLVDAAYCSQPTLSS